MRTLRTHVDSHVADDVTPEAVAGDPGTAAGTQPLTPGPRSLANGARSLAPNARVVPSGRHARPAGGWDCGPLPEDDTTSPGEASQETVRRPGRPRSEKAEQAILEATIEAIGERGIDGVHCEDVATRAGVGKATLYRRWPGKEDLLIAAFAAMRRPLPEPRRESVRDDLVAIMAVMAEDADDPRYAQQYALLHGAEDRYPRLVAGYRERIIEPRRELVRSVLRRGIESGELRQDTDVEVALLMLSGAVMGRSKHDSTPAEPGFPARVVDELLRGLTPR